jgi:hypothetical protein
LKVESELSHTIRHHYSLYMSQPISISKRNQRFQAVKENPDFYDCTVSIRPMHVLYATVWTGLSAAGGWCLGYPRRGLLSLVAATVSGVGAFMMCQQDAFLRLKGYRENSRELDMYGIQKKELVRIIKKRPINLVELQQQEEAEEY